MSDEERLEVASELIASVDGPPDSDWESTWLAELDRRVAAAQAADEPADDWQQARARILRQLS